MEQQIITIELRELQPLLQQTFGNKLIVVRYTTKSLLPPGENYGSSMFSVHAVIKCNNEAEEEDLYLVAKMSAPTEYQRQWFDYSHAFRKEIFMYENILPYYNQLEKEIGLKDDELFDILPKYYKSRLSLVSDIDLDDDAVILMENLAARGYYIGDRIKGCDLEHSKVVIRKLARFHALGIAIKHKKPEYFEVIKKRSKCIDFKMDMFTLTCTMSLKDIEKHPEMSIYFDKCKTTITDSIKRDFWREPPIEPWSTIVHGDFWVNNIMFHHDEDGQLDDVKFVDFQNYRFCSPIRELIFYLFSSTNQEIYDHHLEKLIDLYHETFLTTLEKMGCDIEPFTKEKFDAKLPSNAYAAFMHICFSLKMSTMKVKETEFNYDNLENTISNYEGNQTFIQRLRNAVLYFGEHNWIGCTSEYVAPPILMKLRNNFHFGLK